MRRLGAVLMIIATIAVPLGVGASGAVGTVACSTHRVPVTRVEHVTVTRVLHGRKSTRKVARRVDVKVKRRSRIRVHGKWETIVKEVTEYRTVRTCTNATTPTTTTPTATVTTTTLATAVPVNTIAVPVVSSISVYIDEMDISQSLTASFIITLAALDQYGYSISMPSGVLSVTVSASQNAGGCNYNIGGVSGFLSETCTVTAATAGLYNVAAQIEAQPFVDHVTTQSFQIGPTSVQETPTIRLQSVLTATSCSTPVAGNCSNLTISLAPSTAPQPNSAYASMGNVTVLATSSGSTWTLGAGRIYWNQGSGSIVIVATVPSSATGYEVEYTGASYTSTLNEQISLKSTSAYFPAG